MTPERRRAPAFALTAAALMAVTGAASGGAQGATSRPVIFLDGDASSRTIASEDVLFTQSPSGTTTTEFGSALAFGDVNGDGLADAIVGQRTRNQVFVYLGAAAPRASDWFDDPNLADIVIAAPSGTADRIQQFGFSVAATDLDLDGMADIVVGAPFSDPGGRTDSGLAWAILGNGGLAAGQSFDLDAPPPDVVVVKLSRGPAAEAGDLLGFALGGGSLPGLGDAFLVVTARDADALSPSARADAGAAHVVSGAAIAAAGPSMDLSSGSMATFFGQDPSDALGESVAVCDVDGSGDDDIFLGAIFGDGPGNAGINRGEAFLFLGENIVSGLHAGARSASSADMTVHGASDGDDFGYTVACGDLDEDGRDDMVAGAIFADAIDEAYPSAGEVYVLAGRASQVDPNNPARRELLDPLLAAPQAPVDLSVGSDPNDAAPDGASLALYGATTADQLGFSLAVGDLDADGVGDLVAGARRYDRDQTLVNVGATYVLLGSAGFLDPASAGSARAIDLREGTMRAVYGTFVPPEDHLPDRVDSIVIGASRDDHAAWAAAVGDMNGDGGEELMISAIGDLARAPGFRGEAYVISFSDADADGASDLLDQDNDNDGVTDADELAGTYTSGAPTEPLDADTDADGIQDGTELGFTCAGGGGLVLVACDDPDAAFTNTDPNLALFFRQDQDPNTTTDPLDDDTDDDGLADGAEDADATGSDDAAESDPANHDSDGDGIFDGTERGVVPPLPGGTDPAALHFLADADAGASVTDAADPDTDGDGILDGVEDADRNGEVAGDADHDHHVGLAEIWAETDAADPDTDRDGVSDGVEDTNHDGAASGDSDGDHVVDPGETWTETNPLDQDTDDDGLPDGWIDGANGGTHVESFEVMEGEDRDGDGVHGTGDGESSPLRADSDGDGSLDGTEAGLEAGGGVHGRNQQPDGGPAGDGTDVTSLNFVPDDDAGLTRTEPWDADTDEDGLPDGWMDGVNGAPLDGVFQPVEGEDVDGHGAIGAGETGPATPDSDGDGVRDGVERGVIAPGLLGNDGQPDPISGGGVQDGTGGPALVFDADPNTTTGPLDADGDDDGLSDGQEDANGDGAVGPAEPDPNDPDSDDDLLWDGLERGVVAPLPIHTDLSQGHFTADLDPASTTNPRSADSDGGGTSDGIEDADLNGRVDGGERNPNNRADDDRGGSLVFTDALDGAPTSAPVTAGATLFLRLADADANADPNVAETVMASCGSDFPDAATIALTATGPDIGLFVGSLPTNGADPNIPGELTIASGNTITCTYTDPDDPIDVLSAALGAALTGSPSIPEFDVDLPEPGRLTWASAGPAGLLPSPLTYNLYRGDVASLAATGIYTQAALGCGLAASVQDDPGAPAPGEAFFYLVAGQSGGSEGPLGFDSAGRPRPSTEPCAP